MLLRIVGLLAATLVTSGCFVFGSGLANPFAPSGPQTQANGVAIDSLEDAAMLRDYNETKCPLDGMKVRERNDVAVNAVEVDGCGAQYVYVCIQEISERWGNRYVRTRYVCSRHL
jgi:hypothetical protein